MRTREDSDARTGDHDVVEVASEREREPVECAALARPIDIKEPPASAMFVASVVAFYFVVSMSVVFLNKMIMVHKEYKFPFPLTSTWIQLVVALVCLYVMSEMKARGGNIPVDIPRFSLDIDIVKRVLPLTVVYVGMLAFNNICLRFVPVSMYQVARSQSLTFNIALTYFFLGKKTSFKAIICCVLIVFGYLLGITDTIEVTTEGIVFGLASSFFVALYNLNVERVMPLVNRNQWLLLIYNTTLAIIILFPVLLIFEGPGALLDTKVLFAPPFMAIMLITSLMGFLINIAMFLQIKYTSALTSIVSGTAKAAVQSVVGYFLFTETLSMSEIWSCAIVVIGSAGYSFVRYQEGQAKKKALKEDQNE